MSTNISKTLKQLELTKGKIKATSIYYNVSSKCIKQLNTFWITEHKNKYFIFCGMWVITIQNGRDAVLKGTPLDAPTFR